MRTNVSGLSSLAASMRGVHLAVVTAACQRLDRACAMACMQRS